MTVKELKKYLEEANENWYVYVALENGDGIPEWGESEAERITYSPAEETVYLTGDM